MTSEGHLTDIEDLRRQIAIARTEMKNIRQNIFSMKKKHEKDVEEIMRLLQGSVRPPKIGEQKSNSAKLVSSGIDTLRPIAYMESIFRSKNGTPRQSGVCRQARGKFTIMKSVFTNPEHSLQGLNEFSHIWILFLFHDNGSTVHHAKIRPPRMDGAKTGVFSSRSPHRPNPIGLTLAKLENVEGATVEVSGIDIIDGTPIVDIKPYISQYDQLGNNTTVLPQTEAHPQRFTPIVTDLETSVTDLTEEDGKLEIDAVDVVAPIKHSPSNPADLVDQLEKQDMEEIECIVHAHAAEWISKPYLAKVTFTPRALEGLSSTASHLQYLKSSTELEQAIESVLRSDPRSVYRKEKCRDRLYYFTVDNAHVTAWFDGDVAEVLRVQDSANAK